MSKPKKAPAYVSTVHAAVGEGREGVLDRDSAQAIADASEAAGFPIPPTVAAALGIEPSPPPPADDTTTHTDPANAGSDQQQEG